MLVHSANGEEAGFDPEFASRLDKEHALHVRARNMTCALALQDAALGVSPTEWRRSRFPAELRRKITVVHEDIDTDLVRPSPTAMVRLKQGGVMLRPGDEVVTFVNRNLEPHRGFHVFMRALPEVLRQRPKAHVVIVGGDETSYGPPPRDGRCWREVMLAEVGARLDLDRVHFVGRVPYLSLVKLFQVSAVHVYLTYPFVLSWSLLETMSAGALVIGSRTPPVEEAVTGGVSGRLVGFHNVGALAEAITGARADPACTEHLRRAARATVRGGSLPRPNHAPILQPTTTGLRQGRAA